MENLAISREPVSVLEWRECHGSAHPQLRVWVDGGVPSCLTPSHPTGRCSEALRGDRDREDAVPGDGICKCW